jgi:hypothetical protein
MIKIIGEFFDVFHEELSRLPQEQEVDHTIELIKRATPIPCIPYWHFLLENEDLEKITLNPINPPWAMLILFKIK